MSIGNLRRFFVGGMLGGALATVILFIGTELLGLPFPPLAIFQTLIGPVPGSIQSVVVETFQEYAKYSAFVFSSVLYVVLYGVIAVFLALLLKGDVRSKAGGAIALSTIIPSAIGLGLQLQLAPAYSAISSLYGWTLAILLALAANFVYAKSVIAYVSISVASTKQIPQIASPSPRRSLLKRAAAAGIVLVVAAVAAKFGLSILSRQPVVTSGTAVPVNPNASTATETSVASGAADVFSDPRISDLVRSEVTDNRTFYRVDIDPIPPQLDPNTWTLKIHGKVNNPSTLTEDSLVNMPSVDEYATLECVSNTINPSGGLVSNAKWTGVPLAPLLNQAGISTDAKYVVFRCGDGYSVGIPLDRALLPDAVLAYKMNDETLPREHGFPLRAIIPGIYGMMNAKWITEIEVMDQVYLGYWQERGWSNDARIKTTSIIYYPQSGATVTGSTPIAGVAFAGDRGISKVEVSIDGGNTWDKALLKTPKSSYSWILWAYKWNPTTSGTVNILARAYDATGQIQDPTVVQPFPNGGSGYSSVQVTVE